MNPGDNVKDAALPARFINRKLGLAFRNLGFHSASFCKCWLVLPGEAICGMPQSDIRPSASPFILGFLGDLRSKPLNSSCPTRISVLQDVRGCKQLDRQTIVVVELIGVYFS